MLGLKILLRRIRVIITEMKYFHEYGKARRGVNGLAEEEEVGVIAFDVSILISLDVGPKDF